MILNWPATDEPRAASSTERRLMRLEATRKSDLAVRALAELDRSPERLKSAELAEILCAGTAFMAQVMAPLVKQRWVGSDPGPAGGYQLLVDVHDISVLDVVEAIEGPTDTGRCILADTSCTEERPCALHHAWTKARSTLMDELANTSIAAAAAPNPTRSG